MHMFATVAAWNNWLIGSKKIGKGYIRRRKKCLGCGNRMTTYEIHAEDFGDGGKWYGRIRKDT